MSYKTDWLPHVRSDQLATAREWMTLLGAGGGKAAAWGIPTAALTDLGSAWAAAQAALDTAKNESTRAKRLCLLAGSLTAWEPCMETATNAGAVKLHAIIGWSFAFGKTPMLSGAAGQQTAQCKTAFGALIEKMRDMKKRYFLSPPLVDADYVSLGLKLHDTTPTPSGAPTAQVTVETYLVGRHELGIKIVYVTGDPADTANKGYRIWYKIAAPGEAAPTNPEDLPKSFSTKRKKDVIVFEYGDSGKTAYFAVQIENEGRKGPWGPLVSALIP